MQPTSTPVEHTVELCVMIDASAGRPLADYGGDSYTDTRGRIERQLRPLAAKMVENLMERPDERVRTMALDKAQIQGFLTYGDTCCGPAVIEYWRARNGR